MRIERVVVNASAGTVGVILLAKRRGVISSVKDCLTKLQQAGLWLSQDFTREICMKAGEL